MEAKNIQYLKVPFLPDDEQVEEANDQVSPNNAPTTEGDVQETPNKKVAAKGVGRRKLHIIGVLDASGSMSSWWAWIAEFWNTSIPKNNCYTITFDTHPRVVESNILSKRISEHGGGGTAIPEAFALYEKHLETIPVGDAITTIFISDGEDNHLNTIEKRFEALRGNVEGRCINFICLGIQSAFPYFLSMRLRTHYHRGDETIPALYLIEHASEKAFFNKFETMKKYFYSAGAITIDPPANVYPWDESVVDSVYEGAWVLIKADEVVLNGRHRARAVTRLNVEDAVEVFRGWAQQLQLVQLQDRELAKRNAIVALDEMKRVVAVLNHALRMNLLTISEEVEALASRARTFAERARVNYAFRYGERITWFYKEVEALATSDVKDRVKTAAERQSEYEAAKQMNIGTIIGKHHQKALALKTLTVGEFQAVVNEFLTVLRAKKLAPVTAPAFFAHEDVPADIRSVMLQEDFDSAFQFIRTQFDLVESFSVHGLALKAKRNEGYETDPWQLDVRAVTRRELNLIDLKRADFLYKYEPDADRVKRDDVLFAEGARVGGNANANANANSNNNNNNNNENVQPLDQIVDETKTYEVNCVLPLFRSTGDADEDDRFAAVLNTRLVRFLMSYLVTTNCDLIDDDAYLSLVAQTVQLVVSSGSNSALRGQFIAAALDSAGLFYAKSKAFRAFQEKVCDEAALREAVVAPDANLRKIYAHVLIAHHQRVIDTGHALRLQDVVLLALAHRAAQKHGLRNLVKPNFGDEEKEKITAEALRTLDEFCTISALRTSFAEKFEALIKGSQHGFALAPRAATESFGRLQFAFVQDASRAFFRHAIEDETFAFYARHAVNHEYDYLHHAVDTNRDTLVSAVLAHLDAKNVHNVPGYSDIFKIVDETYARRFAERHFVVRPMTQAQFDAHCANAGADAHAFGFNAATGLCANCCMSPPCPFYLVPRHDLKKHLDAWQGKCPLGFHRFLNARLHLSPNAAFEQAKRKWRKFPANFGVSDEFARKYISDTLAAYCEMRGVPVGAANADAQPIGEPEEAKSSTEERAQQPNSAQQPNRAQSNNNHRGRRHKRRGGKKH